MTVIPVPMSMFLGPVMVTHDPSVSRHALRRVLGPAPDPRPYIITNDKFDGR